MELKEMDKLTKHFDTYFEQDDSIVLHPIVDSGIHIDVLLYKPNAKYPFWKLVTMGASDYKMPAAEYAISDRNEYIMFVDEEEDLADRNLIAWYYHKLLTVATFAYFNNTLITYGHSFEWRNEDQSDEMIGAFIEMPQIIGDVNALKCNLNMGKSVACLQVVLLNQSDIDRLMQIGPQAFSEFLYPSTGGNAHFLCEKHRSEKF